MAAKYVNLPLDIHGGGQDLIFPHHENEIAQTGAATGGDLARYWAHNGFVQINKEKMSKSLGNFFTIRDVLDRFLPEVVRFFLLSQHYRSPLDFSDEALKEAEKGLKRIYTAKAALTEALNKAKWKKIALPQDILDELQAAEDGFGAALDDDLNTAQALGHLFTAVRLAGRVLEDKSLNKGEGARDLFQRVLDDLGKWDSVLAVLDLNPEAFIEALRDKRASRRDIDVAKVNQLLEQRAQARADKDFAASDTLRDELLTLGAEVKDTPKGQVWDVAEG
jgi:cysteinyl-tRNA synthetase